MKKKVRNQNPILIGKTCNKGVGFQLKIQELMRSRMLIQASSGGGKSWAIRKILEETHGYVQQIVLDVEDDFSSLREKYDYILVGKGGDIAADPRSADLLARKILELKANAIINLYELKQHERIQFVKIYFDAMINAPKELWHHVLVILDEAHMFAPEKTRSESLSAVIDMESRGRKRGFCLIPATQRLSKLNKDVAAECQNKLIGLANIDIDRKRAAEELGFSEKKKILSLRDLEPGEFFAVGPAFVRGVTKIKIGRIRTKHHEAGELLGVVKKRVPSKRVSQILAKLTDIPQEAKEELRTKQDMIAKVKQLERELRRAQKDSKSVPVEIKVADPKVTDRAIRQFQVDFVTQLDKAFSDFRNVTSTIFKKFKTDRPSMVAVGRNIPVVASSRPKPSRETPPVVTECGSLGRCERAILKFLAMREGSVFSRVQIGAMTQYSAKSGGFNNALSKITKAGFIVRNNDNIQINQDAIDQVKDVLGSEYAAPEIDALVGWLSKLGKCEKTVFEYLSDHKDEAFTKNDLGGITGYSANSGGFNNAISHLKTLGLIQRNSDSTISINQTIIGI